MSRVALTSIHLYYLVQVDNLLFQDGVILGADTRATEVGLPWQ